MYTRDTIAGIATAPGTGGISIIRVSGDKSLDIVSSVFQCSGKTLEKRRDRSVVYGRICWNNNPVDEVIVILMRAPHSYTKENVVEIQCHGGHIAAKAVMQLIIETGARPAEPGEFTKRAFLNGRIDLVQAEAVLDIINAHSTRAATAAMEQLDGGLSALLTEIYDETLTVQSDLEASLDFIEDELPDSFSGDLAVQLLSTKHKICKLLDTWEEGHLLRHGAIVVIAGTPNVGKSTLLNALLQKERAIVSDIPGTTRDVIEENFLLDGINLRLIDTAGLRMTNCIIEQEGVIRAKSQILKADIVIYVMDASIPPTQEEKTNIKALTPDKSIIILNKTDLGVNTEHAYEKELTTVKCCLVKNTGIELIKKALSAKLGSIGETEPHAVISDRHHSLLLQCDKAVEQAHAELTGGFEESLVLAATELRIALESLGTILGRTYHNDLLNSIFSRFCVGK